MIFGNLDSIEQYRGINKNLDIVFDVLEKEKFNFEDIEVAINNIRTAWGGASTYKDKERADKVVYEAHKQFLDIHLVLEGESLEGYADMSVCTPTTEYNEEKDYILLDAPGNEMTLRAGDFLVYFPCDAHAPVISCKGLKKAVIKIKI